MCYGSPRSSINLSVLEDSFLAEDTTGGFPAEGPVADCFRRRGKQDASDSVEHHCSSSPVLGYLPCIPEEELASERQLVEADAHTKKQLQETQQKQSSNGEQSES